MTDEEQRNRNDIELQAWNCWHDRCAVGRIGHFDREHPEWELHPEWEDILCVAISSAISRQLKKFPIPVPKRNFLVQRFDTTMIVRSDNNGEGKDYKDFVWGLVSNSSDPPLKVIRGKLTGPTGFASRIVVVEILTEMGARKVYDKETGKEIWVFPVEYKDPVDYEGSDVDPDDNPVWFMGKGLKEIGLGKSNEQEIALDELREKSANANSPDEDDNDDDASDAEREPPDQNSLILDREDNASDEEQGASDEKEEASEVEDDSSREEDDSSEGDACAEIAPSDDSSSRFIESVDVFLDPPKELPPDIAKVADSINYRTGALLYASMTSISLADPQLCSFCGISKSAVYNLWNKFLKTINAQSLRGHSNEKLLQAARDAILSHAGGEPLWQRFQSLIKENEQKRMDAEAKKRGY